MDNERALAAVLLPTFKEVQVYLRLLLEANGSLLAGHRSVNWCCFTLGATSCDTAMNKSLAQRRATVLQSLETLRYTKSPAMGAQRCMERTERTWEGVPVRICCRAAS